MTFDFLRYPEVRQKQIFSMIARQVLKFWICQVPIAQMLKCSARSTPDTAQMPNVNYNQNRRFPVSVTQDQHFESAVKKKIKNIKRKYG